MTGETMTATAAAEAAMDTPARIRRERVRLLLRNLPFLVGSLLLIFWIVMAIAGPWIVPYGADDTDLLNTLTPPSPDHWFGTDQFGRDVFSRVIMGSRDILIVAPLATLLGTVVGTVLGLVTGYAKGLTDDVVSRIVDAFLALPLLILAMLVITALGISNTTVIIVIGLSFGLIVGRTVRAAVLGERDLDYVAAAHLRGEKPIYILFVEILPNVMPPIMVETTVRLGYAIFTVASLSFLGLGIQPPSPDWGLSISQNYGLIGGGYWWTVLFYALSIGSLVVGVNLAAEGAQAVLDA
ncbi:MAG TPA: ABC transporter permease [Acidisoma sp.]|jgi:peptide/nickel transport system permease protein|uniref:ABC transporter permease n=1 Tax=Acidisoma sp. TaxID=1872115 RepID=UPI002B728805|nr:ABC transporter permease [Acidisoma sp.]HTI03465.1 ABC transporter permease [Acidisoma sp.]